MQQENEPIVKNKNIKLGAVVAVTQLHARSQTINKEKQSALRRAHRPPVTDVGIEQLLTTQWAPARRPLFRHNIGNGPALRCM